MEYGAKCAKCASFNTQHLPKKCLAYENPKDCRLFIDRKEFSFDVVDNTPNKTNKTPGWYLAWLKRPRT